MSNNKNTETNIIKNDLCKSNNLKHKQQYEICNESFNYSTQDELDNFLKILEEKNNKKD